MRPRAYGPAVHHGMPTSLRRPFEPLEVRQSVCPVRGEPSVGREPIESSAVRPIPTRRNAAQSHRCESVPRSVVSHAYRVRPPRGCPTTPSTPSSTCCVRDERRSSARPCSLCITAQPQLSPTTSTCRLSSALPRRPLTLTTSPCADQQVVVTTLYRKPSRTRGECRAGAVSLTSASSSNHNQPPSQLARARAEQHLSTHTRT